MSRCQLFVLYCELSGPPLGPSKKQLPEAMTCPCSRRPSREGRRGLRGPALRADEGRERLDPSSRKEAKKLKGEAPSNTPQASVGNDKKLPGQTPSPGLLEEVSVLQKSHSLFTHF
ncbi:uncharacterized protein LOC132668753 isoform X3 [Panthera onca]|uniref:uncharacterized protein LOC132668753 isoform X3 n=1 Tax=Panthera onca TaxID=9690 RepID=UPI0029554350|nr:uncharacterized protein LOC132668753 isoform X3 [Panthera onca]